MFITEKSLNAERVVHAVATTVVTRSLPSNSQFEGITASEAHVVDVTRGSVATVMVFGVVEYRSKPKYMFACLNILVEWDTAKTPAKVSLLKWAMREIDWQRATSKERKWLPSQLPLMLNMEDRLLTNDVMESLKFLSGSHPGGIVFTL